MPLAPNAIFTSMASINKHWFPGFANCNNKRIVIYRVCTGPGNPGKSLNFKKSFSRPGKSLNFDAGPGKSWKFGLDYIFYWKICSEVFNLIEHGLIYWCKALVFLTKCSGYFPWCRRPKHVRIVFFSYENQLPIHDFWSWKIEKKSWKGPGKVLEGPWICLGWWCTNPVDISPVSHPTLQSGSDWTLL